MGIRGGFVNLIRSLFNSIYLKRKRIISIAAILILIPMFQNCGGAYTSRGLSSTGTDSSNSTGDGSGGVVPPPAGGSVLPLADLQKLCKSVTTTPSLNDVGSTEVTVFSGLGAANAGDMSSAAVHVTASRGITDTTTFSKYACDSQYSLSLSCSVVSGDANYPISITNVFDVSGNDLLKASPVKATLDLAKSSVMSQNCNVLFGAGKDNLDFVVAPNTKNERCVQGSYWLKLSISNQVAGTTGMNNSPTVKYLKVNMNNGCWVESRLKDPAGDLPSVINFGTAVAMDSGWAAVVAPNDDAAGVADVGSVYMFKYDGANWVKKDKVMIADAAARDGINSVAIRGDTMVLGSPYRNSVGAAFFFRRSGDTWNLVQRVDAQDATQQYQDFGFSVAMNDGYVFVSSPSYAVGALSKAGTVSVYSYTASGMTYIKTLSGVNANSAFGYALAADNSTLAVGAPQAIGKEALAEGSVYLVTASGGAWNLSASIKKGTTLAEKFGATVAILGNKLAVGSPNFSVTGRVGEGRVTYFSDYTVAAATKTWSGAEAGANMGQGLALSSTGVYVASPYGTARTGYVDHYLYSKIDSVYFHLMAYNGTANSAFGWSVAASGNDVVVGARIKNDPNDNSGAGYIYRYK